MTRDDWNALGLRALAAGFEWGRGAVSGCGLLCVSGASEWSPAEFWERPSAGWSGLGWAEDDGSVRVDARDAKRVSPWPDFADPATLGVLEAQLLARGGVRLARGDGWFEVETDGGVYADQDNCPNYETALVRALEEK